MSLFFSFFFQNSLDFWIVSVCHGGNSDDLVSIPAMTGTVAVNFCVYLNGLDLYKNNEMYLGALCYLLWLQIHQVYLCKGIYCRGKKERSILITLCSSQMTRNGNKKNSIFFISPPYNDGQVLHIVNFVTVKGCLSSTYGMTFHPFSSLRHCSRVVSQIEIKENKFWTIKYA